MGYWTNSSGIQAEPDPQFDPRNQGFTWVEDAPPPPAPTTWQDYIGQTWQGAGGAYGQYTNGPNMQNYLTSVSNAMGQPNYDWLPYLKASEDAHKAVYGAPWVSGRGNVWAATNDVLSRAGQSKYAISPEDVNKEQWGIQDFQGATNNSGDWKPIIGGLAAVASAGLLGPELAGAEAGLGTGAAGAFDAAGFAGTGVMDAAGIGGAGSLAGIAEGASIPELGMVANPATADAAIAGGIPATTLGGGTGALTLADIAAQAGITGAPTTTGTTQATTPIVGGEQAGAYSAGDIPVGGNVDINDFLNQFFTESGTPNFEEAAATSADQGANMNVLQEQLKTLMVDPTAFGSLPPGLQQAIKALTSSGMSQGSAASALARLMGFEPNSTGADLTQVGGSILPAILGAYASNRQTSALENLANQQLAIGASSRGRYEGSYAPGFTMQNEPGYSGALADVAKSSAHALSTTFGNPALSPNATMQNNLDIYNRTAYPALQNYRNQNAATGGYNAFNAAAPGTQTAAVGSNANFYNAIGGGIADIFNPPKSGAQSLMDFYKMMYGGARA